MTSTDIEKAGRLLHIFDAETLGDGNVVAGANVLAAMALTIANIQRPGSAVVGADGFRTALGCSMVVSGALSSSLTADLVLAPLQAKQDNVFANVRHWEEEEQRRWDKLVRTGREVENDPENPPTPALADLNRDAMLGDSEHTTRCLSLLVRPAGAGFREICRHPMVFGIAGGPDSFARLMESAHLGRPLVHVALSAAVDCPAYQKVASRLIRGCQLFQPEIRGVRGELVVTDPGNALGEAVSGGHAGTDWLGGALWLSDHAAGPAFEAKVPDAAKAAYAKLDRVAARFGEALKQSWAGRLSAGSGKPAIFPCDVRDWQYKWVRFLLDLEPSFPGISGALRALPASLLFGLVLIRTARPVANGEPIISIKLAYAFAGMLALRMTNARELMLRHSQQARIDAIAESVRGKLADGPLTVRELTRRSHRLAAADCEASLGVLLSKGLVTRTGNLWCLSPAATPTPTITLDV